MGLRFNVGPLSFFQVKIAPFSTKLLQSRHSASTSGSLPHSRPHVLLSFRPHALQTNSLACELLYKAVLELLLPLPPAGPVFDVCSGAGTIALCIASAAKKQKGFSSDGQEEVSAEKPRVLGLEVLAAAVDDARRNASINELESDVQFVAGGKPTFPSPETL